MAVVVPADDVEAYAATMALADYEGPAYLRVARLASPTIHEEDYEFHLGKGDVLRDGSDVCIVACGMMVPRALDAAEALAAEGIEAQVVNMHTIKPLDVELLTACAKKTGKVVTVEEGSIVGGLGSAVCEALSENCPVPVRRIGMPDCFGTSGEGNQLLDHFGLTADHIAQAAQNDQRHCNQIDHRIGGIIAEAVLSDDVDARIAESRNGGEQGNPDAFGTEFRHEDRHIRQRTCPLHQKCAQHDPLYKPHHTGQAVQVEGILKQEPIAESHSPVEQDHQGGKDGDDTQTADLDQD
jgi:hypothetical protein